jgi:hypothetical protein
MKPLIVKDLNDALASVKPNNSETAQLITYTLVGAALVGIMVYHYIKSQEDLN